MRILDRISGLVSRSTGLILVLTILLTSLAVTRIVDLASGEMRLEIDPSTNRLLSEDNEARAFYDRVRRMFGSDETLVITLTSDDIFTADNFRRIDRITRRIDDLESVHHVSSLTNALDIRSIDDSLDIAPFIENVTDDPATIADVRVYPQRPAREDLGHCRGGKRRQHGLAHRCTALQGRHYRHPDP
jgi:predicted RND superfamily exporter protein